MQSFGRWQRPEDRSARAVVTPRTAPGACCRFPAKKPEREGWMAANNAAIMAVLCLVIGAKLIGDGISGLA